MPAPHRPRQSPRGDSFRTGGSPHGRAGPRRGAATLAELSPRLQPRDRVIGFWLSDHIALTTAQLASVLFGSLNRCRNRLYTLYHYQFVGRVIRALPGQRARVYWVPGRLSARLVALARDEPPPTPKTVAAAQDRVLSTHSAAHHLLETNQFFIDLLAHARHHPDTRLTRWWSEARTSSAFGRPIRADGHGVWEAHGRSVGFFLEHDRGSEDHRRLHGKLLVYHGLHVDGGPDYPVLFSFPTSSREANFHHRLATAAGTNPRLAEALSTLTVATCARDLPGFHPAGAVWAPLDHPGRLTLGELPASHGQPGPLTPGPPTGEQDPLHELRPRHWQQPA
jgi:protein involved in plasmid replication-relaxation